MSRVISLNRYRQIIMSLPILTVLISIFTMIIAYTVATNERDDPSSGLNCTLHNIFPPYISDVGDCKPQSSVFTFGMILSGCVSVLIFTIRFLQVRNFYVARELANTASIITGIFLVVGKFMAISFQLSSQKLIHYVGACTYFFGTFVYVCFQARISLGHNRILCVLRTVIAFGLFLTGLLFAVFIIPSVEREYLEWNVSQVSEWIFGALKMLFMLSFWFDFRDIVLIMDAKHVRKQNSYEDIVEFTYDNVTEEEALRLERKPSYGHSTAV